MIIFKNLILYILIAFFLLFCSEMLARKIEKYPFQKLSKVSYESIKENLTKEEWEIFEVQACTNEIFNDFNLLRKPLVPLEHLNQNNKRKIAQYTDELSLTFNGRGPRDEKEKNIFILGGSTIYGDGLECQEYTLPAALNRSNKLNSYHNYGFSAYSNTETTNYFIKLLKYSFPIKEAWFIEGVNDVMQKVVLGTPSYTFGFSALGMSGRLNLRYAIIESLSSRSALFRILTGITPMINANIVETDYLYPISVNNFSQISTKEKIIYRSKIASEIVIENYSFVKKLAEYQDIEVLFFIQPNLLNKLYLTSVEKKILRKIDEYFSVELLKLAFNNYYKMLLENSKKNKLKIIDLRSCFKNVKKTIFFDLNHLSPQGNQVLAKCILEKLKN